MPEPLDLIGDAVSLIVAGDADAALALLAPTLEVTPDHFQAQFLKGEALRCAGKLEQAEEVLQLALRLAPGNPEVLFRLGLTQYGRDRPNDALLSFRLTTQSAPTHQQGWFYVGLLNLQLDRLDDALQGFRRALDLDATSVPTLVNLAMCLQKRGEFAESNKLLLQALALEPARDDIARTLFQNLTDIGDFAGAESLTRVMTEQYPESTWWAGEALGWVLRTVGRDAEAAQAYLRAFEIDPSSADFAAQAGLALRHAGQAAPAKEILIKALELDPVSMNGHVGMAGVLSDEGKFDEALAGLESLFDIKLTRPPRRSVVIPILDYSPGSPYNIRTLLDDLRDFDGEVICIFNNLDVFSDLKDHPRIDKYSVNKHNVGVSRAWNMGINQAEGATIHILNADLHISVAMLDRLEKWLHELPDALCVGVSAHWYDIDTLKELRSQATGQITEPVEVDNVSGQLFSLHANRLNEAGITFDPRLAPYFGEELDLFLKARQVGLKIYAVPETDFEHTWGISRRDRPITCFGRPVHRLFCIVRNQVLLRKRAQRLKASFSRPPKGR